MRTKKQSATNKWMRGTRKGRNWDIKEERKESWQVEIKKKDERINTKEGRNWVIIAESRWLKFHIALWMIKFLLWSDLEARLFMGIFLGIRDWGCRADEQRQIRAPYCTLHVLWGFPHCYCDYQRQEEDLNMRHKVHNIISQTLSNLKFHRPTLG